MSSTCATGLSSGASHIQPAQADSANCNSQDSLISETSISQFSEGRASSVENIQGFDPNNNNDHHTPSTSLSNHSSQENVVTRGNADESQANTDGGSRSDRIAPIDTSHTEQSGGYKRTATGQIKSPTHESLPLSPADSSSNGHSRNISMSSRSSHIAEISNKLQARLSYAKVKLQHGWEGHNISELERMTSNLASPVSVSSYTVGHSTPLTYSPVDQPLNPRDLRGASTSVPLDYKYPLPPNQSQFRHSSNVLDDLATPRTAAMANPVHNETYEQFWQSHSNHTVPLTRLSDVQSSNGRSLAPPVDFSPRSTLSNNSKPQISDSSQFPGQLPSTPPARHLSTTRIRTPSQQAAVEQDALEGLLSMNSPIHSQSQPVSRPLLRSPLHNKAAEPSLLLNGIVSRSSISFMEPAQSASATRELNDDEINKMLDNMPDSSSSDEENVVVREYPTAKLLQSS